MHNYYMYMHINIPFHIKPGIAKWSQGVILFPLVRTVATAQMYVWMYISKCMYICKCVCVCIHIHI